MLHIQRDRTGITIRWLYRWETI